MPTFERQPTKLADVLEHDPMFAKRADGSLVQRSRTCECGRSFVQTQLSARFMEVVELVSERAVKAMLRGVPDLFVPVHCPRCERIDIGRQAHVDQHHTDYPMNRQAAD